VFQAGDFTLQSGEVLEQAHIAIETYGTLAADRANAIAFFTPFASRHSDIEWLIDEGKALDPAKYFIVIPNMIGNGLSSSPTSEPWVSRRRFPRVTTFDNVELQQRALSGLFGIKRLKLAVGWSMGGQQAYHWAAIHPDQVERVACICGAAKTSQHNFVFLESVSAALEADPAFEDGWFASKPTRGLKAVALSYASWALSQAFYRVQKYKELGFASLEEFLSKSWYEPYLQRDGNNMRAMLWTWQHSDISNNRIYQGNFEKALGAITANALIMPSKTDLYFQTADNAREVSLMRKASLLPIPSIWGHRAGNNPRSLADARFVDDALMRLLSE
jgi:homoserine O-acetyltransferase